MHLIIGLGPIGGNIGAHLAEQRQPVYGCDFDLQRVREWTAETGSPAATSVAEVEWTTVDSVHIAVRLADQVSAVVDALTAHTARPLTVFVHTTLAPTDARRIMSCAPEGWRVFEAPVSGGPRGAREGTLSIFLSGPPTSAAEDALLQNISGRTFRLESYGQPALVKLLNNALATCNLAATARMLSLAEKLGTPATSLLDVIGASTGQSWMSDNFIDVQYDLLVKDVDLLSDEIGALPDNTLGDDIEGAILGARSLLASVTS